jgi:PhnB protein
MSDTTPPTPNGVIAYLTVKDGAAALDFYTKAFGAALQYKKLADDGKRLMHARLEVNGGVLMLSDDFPEYNGGVSMAPALDQPRGITLHMQVPDCDATFSQAVEAGAAGIMPPADMFWGDRYARLRDPFGHVWSLAHAVRK